jgi:hypothetical protein
MLGKQFPLHAFAFGHVLHHRQRNEMTARRIALHDGRQ